MTIFGIGIFDNKVKEVPMTNSKLKMDNLYQIFDENGQHKLNKFSTEPKAELNIDFSANKLEVFVIIPELTKVSTNKIVGSIESARCELILSKDFKISSDFQTVIIDEIKHVIPKFFNRKMIQKEDKNTWEMIFRQILQKEIFDEIQKQKELQTERIRNLKLR